VLRPATLVAQSSVISIAGSTGSDRQAGDGRRDRVEAPGTAVTKLRGEWDIVLVGW
jgi:hypothetical protein